MTTASHPGLGLGVVTGSGILTASFPVPMNYSLAWNWENTWLVYATFALVLLPLGFVLWALPHPFSFYRSGPASFLLPPLLFGFNWGIAQVTFGLSIARVGMAMAFAVVIGLSAMSGSVVSLAVFHPRALTGRPGGILFISAILLAGGLFLYARAGREREASTTQTRRVGGSFLQVLLLCIFTGCFGSMINMAFVFGGRIAEQAVRQGISAPRATLCVWAVVLSAGYLPNAAYTLYLLRRNRSTQKFVRSFPRETLLALAAAIFGSSACSDTRSAPELWAHTEIPLALPSAWRFSCCGRVRSESSPVNGGVRQRLHVGVCGGVWHSLRDRR